MSVKWIWEEDSNLHGMALDEGKLRGFSLLTKEIRLVTYGRWKLSIKAER